MGETTTAVLDRIEDGQTAVLLLEDDEATLDECSVDIETLPDEGRQEGAVFTVTLDGGSVLEAEYRPDETQARRESAQEQFDRLFERHSDG